MNIDCLLKWTQFAFYITGGTIAILTYLKAKKGLLNTVNTEYQKKALIKVEEISDYLVAEFDEDSELHWTKQRIVEDCVKDMLEQFTQNREFFIKEQRWVGGIPDNPTTKRLDNWVRKVKSDPFVPKTIRDIVVNYLETRVDEMLSIHIEELRAFGDRLVKNPQKYENQENLGASVHNRINSKQYEHGCGISQVEGKIHELRLEIQKYYEKFDPFIK